MSRPHSNENLNAVQLFPFVAVLLCTMGSLLVLLVAVARSSRNQAIELAAVEQAAAAVAAAADAAASPPIDEEELRRHLEEARLFAEQLREARERAQRKLRDDRLHLSHVEDHIRRLQEELAALQLAAAELNSKAGDHYDDRQQAERELKRLEQLIAEARARIDELRNETTGKHKSVAILPYEDDDGTRRPPIYLECTEHGVCLQPEGIQLVMQDFFGPLGPSSPLAAALRAAREHLVKQNPTANGDDFEPYALLIVRPGGQIFFHAACQVIQRSAIDFGYELVEADWNLKYPTADPQLATVESQAIEAARIHLRMLASAAPGVYGPSEMWEDEDDGKQNAKAGGRPRRGAPVPSAHGGYMVIARRSGGDKPDVDPLAPADAAKQFDTGRNADDKPQEPAASKPKEFLAGELRHRPPPDAVQKPQEEPEAEETPAQARGQDWAIQRMPGTVPIRRTVQIVVREDRLSILPESASSRAKPGREIVLQGSTDASIDTFVSQLQTHIEDWGIAGQGLAWRPVLELKVGPDGEGRADDLVRLLKHSGIEVQTSVAQHESGDPSRASR